MVSVDVKHHVYLLSESCRESRRDQEEGGELDSHEEVRLSFADPAEIKRREVVLGPQESPEEIKSRGGGAGLRKFRLVFCFSCSSTAVLRTLALWPICSVRQLKQHLRGTLVATQWRGLHWCWSTASSVFRVGARDRATHSSSLPRLVPIPNKPLRFCGRKAICFLSWIVCASRSGPAVRR